MQRLSGQKMAVKRAIALADLSAVEPTCKCLNRREEISKLGPSWERNRAEQVNTGQQSREEGWDSQTDHRTQHRAPKSQTFGLALVCPLGGSAG